MPRTRPWALCAWTLLQLIGSQQAGPDQGLAQGIGIPIVGEIGGLLDEEEASRQEAQQLKFEKIVEQSPSRGGHLLPFRAEGLRRRGIPPRRIRQGSVPPIFSGLGLGHTVLAQGAMFLFSPRSGKQRPEKAEAQLLQAYLANDRQAKEAGRREGPPPSHGRLRNADTLLQTKWSRLR